MRLVNCNTKEIEFWYNRQPRCILISLKTRETVSNKGSVRFVELDKRLHVIHNTEDKAYSLHN